jgi:hypothetical protein
LIALHRLTDGYTPNHEDQTAELAVMIGRHLACRPNASTCCTWRPRCTTSARPGYRWSC